MSYERFVAVAHMCVTPSALRTAKRHTRVEDAIADMGDGVVFSVTFGLPDRGLKLRLVAFHERHAQLVAVIDTGERVS